MSQALRAELIKLSTTRTFVALTAAALGLSLLVVVLATSIDTTFGEDDLRALFAFDQSGLFILLLGAIGMSGEWRHRTIASTVLAVPQRFLLMGAKVIAYAAAGIVLSLLVTVTIMAVGSLILSARGEETLAVADMADVLWRNLAVAAFFGAFGVCAGTLVRNTAGVIVLLLALLLVFEPTLFGLAPEVGRFSPLVGAPAGVVAAFGDGEVEELLGSGVALLVLCGWLAVLFAAASATLKQRDLV